MVAPPTPPLRRFCYSDGGTCPSGIPLPPAAADWLPVLVITSLLRDHAVVVFSARSPVVVVLTRLKKKKNRRRNYPTLETGGRGLKTL